ncbi:methyltransferase domain-containing protein [Caldichromatium japonicum]|uniref:Methyltransferase domain-containing protein n=1 Tax=Caldichromatium japonicum TaxID=2699430 RepID=A0A6G7VG98_9GAMM|nr:class I SAM-dependent methyltransferase [Caldichromatium japonicum]QIK38817.1 methyltransferase domain-containing protein [Caldichromatium japonicum]
MTWNLGYNTDLGYTYGYYREQDPSWLDLCALIKGAAPPSLWAGDQLRYLELGCGQGLNLCLIAACHPQIEFVGIDFNPQHIAHAQRLAHTAGLHNVRFIEGNFVELGRAWPAELGRFQYASAHGILSWIGRTARDGLYACLDAALLPGALGYFSYNTLPGWLSTLPVQHLLRLWQTREGLSSLKAIELGRARFETMIQVNAAMCRVLPAMRARIGQLAKHDRSYLVNEYLHEEWTAFWFDELAAEMSPHKLTYLGTAAAGDWYLPVMLLPDWRAILNQYEDPIIRETMFDVLINQSFRRDLWIKGQTPLWLEDQRQAILNRRCVLLNRPQPKAEGQNPYQFNTSLGEIQGKPEVYGPLYEAVAAGPKTIAELMHVPVGTPATGATPAANLTLGDVLKAVGLMLHAGHIALVHEVKSDKPAKSLNRTIFNAVLAGGPYRHVIASALPWVLMVSDVDLMLCGLYLANPKVNAQQLAGLWVDRLSSLGRGLIHEGQSLTSRETMLPRAQELATVFIERTFPTWQRLGVI